MAELESEHKPPYFRALVLILLGSTACQSKELLIIELIRVLGREYFLFISQQDIHFELSVCYRVLRPGSGAGDASFSKRGSIHSNPCQHLWHDRFCTQHGKFGKKRHRVCPQGAPSLVEGNGPVISSIQPGGAIVGARGGSCEHQGQRQWHCGCGSSRIVR